MRRLNSNIEARLKHPDNPERFADSEIDLHDEIQRLRVLAGAPELYPDLVSLNAVPSIVGLLNHDNIDIAIDAVNLLQDLTDEDVLEDNDEPAKVLVDALVENNALELLVQILGKLSESDPDENAAVHAALATIENMVEVKPAVAEIVCERTRLLKWILGRIKVKEFDGNKQYASEILAILLQGSPANQKRLGAMNGVDVMLQAVAMYKSRDPKSSDEEEMVENLFDCLCCLLMPMENKERFVKAEGVELMLIIMKQKKSAYGSAVRALDFAMTKYPPACERFVDVLGLKTAFAAFMGGIVRGSRRDRLLGKFVENECEKIDRLMELYVRYSDRVKAESERLDKLEFDDLEMDEEERYNRKLEAGLYTLQLIAVILGHLWSSEHPRMKARIELLLRQQKLTKKDVKHVVQDNFKVCETVKNRWLGFLIWQSISVTSVYLLLLLLRLSTPDSLLSLLLSFLAFHLSLLLFSFSISTISSPRPLPSSSPSDLALGLFRALIGAGEGDRIRSRRTVGFVVAVVGFGVSGFLSGVAVFGRTIDGLRLVGFGLRGFVFGVVLGVYYVYMGRWVLSFPIVQVLQTRRCIFAPSQGSAAAETNPSEPLLAALEQSSQRSLFHYLAYLDLCLVSESNVDSWRRAAFFEESGETYRRIVSVCLRPLEELTSNLGEGLGNCSADKEDLLSRQLCSPMDIRMDAKLQEALNDFQLCTWCARTVAALTTCSHMEDRFGVAQISGCNAAVFSTLLSCLLSVEACLGKKTNPQPTHFMGPASIRWATPNAGRKDWAVGAMPRKRGVALQSRAYVMADVLRTSIYEIVGVFYDEMQANAKASVLEKYWIDDGKILYGNHETLVQKLRLFLDFCAT
ncbi:hypothetical protein QJS10_CPA03g02524 [Acorus calamus]|uniref:Beta-catenin-like protein 1 N-terminal domain-containing protein n=2 Tax=Magnoliopsida TaxID=3398 RepID=A0AAV9FAG8_ACOCL|nr:hypothetical protein QJS10_CPA03g02524 [Acorus calamus]